VGSQAGTWQFAALGRLDSRCVWGAWFYATDRTFYSTPEPLSQHQSPIGSFEGHLSYDFPERGRWASLNGNFWFGGIAELNGLQNPATKQANSRLGGNRLIPGEQASIEQGQLQRRDFCPVWRQLPEPYCGVAVAVERAAILTGSKKRSGAPGSSLSLFEDRLYLPGLDSAGESVMVPFVLIGVAE
jgi:hypothetical protein